MTITGAIVVFAITWFMVFFIVLPIRFVSQGDVGQVVPGTPKGAPADFTVGRKARITTAISVVLAGAIIGVIVSGRITIADIDIFNRGAQTPVSDTGG